MRAFYRIKRSDWPLTINGEKSKADSIALGGTAALLIVHSSIYPNAALERLTDSKFLGNTYAEVMSDGIATATQISKVFKAEWENGIDKNGDAIRGSSKAANVPSGATIRRANLIPHSWGGKESVIEQDAVDTLP